MEQSVLSVRDLVKVYPGGVRALDGVSFDVDSREFSVVIGLSGSGKSTLLRCINRLQDPTSGTVRFHGDDITDVKGRALRKVRQDMAMIFQHFNLVHRYSVLDNVLTGALGRTGTFKSLLKAYSEEDRAQAVENLRLVGLSDKLYVRAGDLSGGQQQRVAIARALMQNPKLLLADEPVASLDPATCHSIMDYLRRVNEELEITVLCNLHFLSLVREYGTRVLALKDGKLVFEGPPTDIDQDWFEKIYGAKAREVQIN